MDTTEISKPEFFQDQLTLRKYYFDFVSSSGVHIEHTVKGTVITVTADSGDRCRELWAMAEISPTKEEPVKFKIWIVQSQLQLGGTYRNFLCSDKDFILIHSGEVEGSIMLTDSGKLKTKIGDDVKRDSMQNDTCVIFVCFSARKTKKL